MYKVVVSKTALKKFRKLLPSDKKKVLKVIKELELDPLAPHLKTKKLKGKKNVFYRVRMGDLRLIFYIESSQVFITKVDFRGAIYRT